MQGPRGARGRASQADDPQLTTLQTAPLPHPRRGVFRDPKRCTLKLNSSRCCSCEVTGPALYGRKSSPVFSKLLGRLPKSLHHLLSRSLFAQVTWQPLIPSLGDVVLRLKPSRIWQPRTGESLARVVFDIRFDLRHRSKSECESCNAHKVGEDRNNLFVRRDIVARKSAIGMKVEVFRPMPSSLLFPYACHFLTERQSDGAPTSGSQR